MAAPTSKLVALQFPILLKNKEGGVNQVYQVEVKRLQVRHLRLLPDSFLVPLPEGGKREISKHEFLPLIQALTDLDEDAAGQIDLTDMDKIVNEAESFFQ
jgi:hypothetical protein